MNAEDRYRQNLIADAEAAAAGAHEKVAKLEAHLAGAREAAETADAELQRVQSGDVEFVASSQSIRVNVAPAEKSA